MVPFGSLFSGWLADKIGAPNTLMMNGIFCILGSFIFARQLPVLTRLVSPVYIQRAYFQKRINNLSLIQKI
jgi:nitrate/nitrite transporter NarK